MERIAVVYWSGTGNTEAMANAVADGARGAGAEAELLPVAEFDPSSVASYRAVAFGCPAMGAETLEEDEFAPAYEAAKPALAGKKVGLFGSYGWGDGEWMRNWEEDVRAAGADLAADPVTCNDAPDDAAIDACAALGKVLA